jgi:hypothetical protein
VTTYTGLWHEVDRWLRATSDLMRADLPALHARLEGAFREWLDHNELELALDELLNAAESDDGALRRRFWEQLAVAAMRMRLEAQFLRIVDRIPNLEPHIFGTEQSPPYVYCDYNGMIETGVYSLNGVGTALDFARLRAVPSASQRLILYDADSEDDGSPTWLLANALVVEHEPFGLVAKVARDTFRSRPR